MADFSICKGTTWQLTVSELDSAGAAVDMTNVTSLWMQVRPSASSATVIVEVSLSNGRITWVSQVGGVFRITIPASVTASMEGGGAYDLLQTWVDGTVVKLLEGGIVLSPTVTRV